MDLDINLERFINYIVSVMLDETEMKKLSPVQNDYISFPWQKALLVPNNKARRIISYNYPPNHFNNYIFNNFSLDEGELMFLIWDKYREKLINYLY